MAHEPVNDAPVVHVDAGGVELEGNLVVLDEAEGIVLFAHGSGSSRFSPRNRHVAEMLQDVGLATLLIDLLTEEEEQVDRVTAGHRFDIPMLARRLTDVIAWLQRDARTASLRIGLFGSSTGAAAALIAAAEEPEAVGAVVSRGGRVDLAAHALPDVQAPVLLLVGGRDPQVLALNRQVVDEIQTEQRLDVIEGASHLFEEPGALDEVARRAADWFVEHLTRRVPGSSSGHSSGDPPYEAASPGSATAVEAAELPARIREAATPFDGIDTANLDAVLDRIGDARVVLIGEATHGTSEFYRMRQRITRGLIERGGIRIVAVEADWPDARRLDHYVRPPDRAPERPWEPFARFPTWMWRNHQALTFVEWLRSYNAPRPAGEQVGFFGLDLYSLYTSIHEVLRYLEDVDPELAETARERYNCLTPFQAEPTDYGRAVLTDRYRTCEDEVVEMLTGLLRHRIEYAERDGERYFDAEQNARVVTDAERYYRTMYYGAPMSWNLRDGHMFETLEALLRFFGPDATAVVWAHNSHVGDARATAMSDRGERNLGQMARERFGDGAYLIGFGTHTGTVAAASRWGAEPDVMPVRPSDERSYEHLCHASGVDRFLLPLRPISSAVKTGLEKPRLERAIGVVYRPDTEFRSHYFRAVLPAQFDEYIWFDETSAVQPLGRTTAPDLAERHPFLLAD